MTARTLAAPLAVFAAAALIALAAACGDSVGNYCDYTDCNAATDAASDGAVTLADAGSDAS